MFDDLRPKDLKIFQKAHQEIFRENDRYLHRCGFYIMDAMGVVMANSFSSSKSNQAKYMERSIEDQREFDEKSEIEKIDDLRQQHAMDIATLRSNFLVSKNRKDDVEE